MDKIYEFVFNRHDTNYGLRCNWSNRIVPPGYEVHLWGMDCATSVCPGCGRQVVVDDIPVPLCAQPGDLVNS